MHRAPLQGQAVAMWSSQDMLCSGKGYGAGFLGQADGIGAAGALGVVVSRWSLSLCAGCQGKASEVGYCTAWGPSSKKKAGPVSLGVMLTRSAQMALGCPSLSSMHPALGPWIRQEGSWDEWGWPPRPVLLLQGQRAAASPGL